MPIFEYTCDACGKKFDELVFGDENPPCPACGSEKVTKIMSRCRSKCGGGPSDSAVADAAPASSSSGGGCSGCSGGSCSTCGC